MKLMSKKRQKRKDRLNNQNSLNKDDVLSDVKNIIIIILFYFKNQMKNELEKKVAEFQNLKNEIRILKKRLKAINKVGTNQDDQKENDRNYLDNAIPDNTV